VIAKPLTYRELQERLIALFDDLPGRIMPLAG
jgi:hypothetical protein